MKNQSALQYRRDTTAVQLHASEQAEGGPAATVRLLLFPGKRPILRRLNFKRGASFVIRLHVMPPASASDIVSSLRRRFLVARLRPRWPTRHAAIAPFVAILKLCPTV